MGSSALELQMLAQIRSANMPEPLTEYRFHPTRRWRFDFAYPDRMVAIEVEGGIWSRGRHTRGKGFEEDCRKYNEAACLGWRVIRVTGGMLDSGEALPYVIRALGGKE